MRSFDNFLDIMDKLLGPDGCPWDREQTHESLKQHLLEECYETIEAINNQDMASLQEELGDVLLQVVFHAKLAEAARAFTIDDVIEAVSHKLVSRHTHIFGEDTATSADDVVRVWEANKQKERKHSPEEAMNDVPRALPALMRAEKVVKRSGCKLSSVEELVADIQSQLGHVLEPDNEKFAIIGSIMLNLVRISVILGINVEFSLTNTVEKFITTTAQKARGES